MEIIHFSDTKIVHCSETAVITQYIHIHRIVHTRSVEANLNVSTEKASFVKWPREGTNRVRHRQANYSANYRKINSAKPPRLENVEYRRGRRGGDDDDGDGDGNGDGDGSGDGPAVFV